MQLTKFEDFLSEQYGPLRTKSRQEYELGFMLFKIAVELERRREELGIPSRELAKRCGLSVNVVSKLQSDPRTMTFSQLSILALELGYRLKVQLELDSAT